jgi:hypothetical protein
MSEEFTFRLRVYDRRSRPARFSAERADDAGSEVIAAESVSSARVSPGVHELALIRPSEWAFSDDWSPSTTRSGKRCRNDSASSHDAQTGLRVSS